MAGPSSSRPPVVGKELPIRDVSLSASIGAKQTLINRTQQSHVKIRVACGGSIPESAGGVTRRFGEGLLTGHHFRKQPPGDRFERETVMGMAKGEPQTPVPLAFADHRDHIGQTRPAAHPGFRFQSVGQRKQFPGQCSSRASWPGLGGASRSANSTPVVRRTPLIIGASAKPPSASRTGWPSPALPLTP